MLYIRLYSWHMELATLFYIPVKFKPRLLFGKAFKNAWEASQVKLQLHYACIN